MYRDTADILLPKSLIGLLPRPYWCTNTPRTWTYLQAIIDPRSHKQYVGPETVRLRDHEVAGHDICTDSDAH